MKRGPKPKSLLERFNGKYIPEPNTGCWLWTASQNGRGYGVIGASSKPLPLLAHRVSYLLFNGPIPTDLWVLHKCDVKSCVNPAHLFLGTPLDNMQDKIKKGRDLVGEQHPGAKLTASAVTAIRAATGTQKEIGAMYGVSGALIGCIKRNELWKGVA